MNLADLPVDALAELLDAAREADDAGLILIYSDALVAHAQDLSDCYFPEARPQQEPPAGEWAVWMICSGRAWGKALAIDTSIPTPTGWTTMADIRVGQAVLGADGLPVIVEQVHAIQHGRECYRVEFIDGSSVVADADHLWLTTTHAARKASRRRKPKAEYIRDRGQSSSRRPECEPQVRTTAEIACTLTQGKRADRNHAIQTTAPLKLPEADLPIDPYVLGYWLGDGSSATAAITIGDEDAQVVLELLAACGEPRTGSVGRKPGTVCATYPIGGKPQIRNALGQMAANDSLHSRLKALGVMKNKHIPMTYLRASIDQRRALLAGLLDSDGSAELVSNRVELTFMREPLIRGAEELIVSLGWRCTVRESDATINGRVVGRRWRLAFRPTEQVFQLPRKAERLTFGQGQRGRHAHRMITGVTPVESVPVRCITVAADDGLYLCGRAMIPTHNTRTGAEWIVEQALTTDGVWGVEGPTFGAARKICMEGRGADPNHPSGILSVLDRRGITPKAWNRTNGELLLENGSLIVTLSADQPDRVRGYNLSGAWCDELSSWPYEDSWDQLRLALRTGMNPQIVVTTTPKPVNLIRRLLEQEGPKIVVTRGTIYDNRANLSEAALAEFETQYAGSSLGAQELLGEVVEIGGNLIDPSRFVVVSHPPDYPRKVRSWDLAGSIPSALNPDPDFSVGALVSYQPDPRPYVVGQGTDQETTIQAGSFCIEDVIRLREGPSQVEQAVLNAARRDGPAVKVVIEREPGQSGLSQLDHFRQVLQGVALVEEFRPSGPKEVRAQLVATAGAQGRVQVVGGEWRQLFYDECQDFPYGKHDDQVDAVSAAFAALEGRGGMASATAPTGQLPSRDAVLSGGRGMSTGIPRGR